MSHSVYQYQKKSPAGQVAPAGDYTNDYQKAANCYPTYLGAMMS
jgi:hypothetical protein